MIIKLASWNINSIRLRIGLIEKFSNEFEIDILCLQECKCEEKDMPYEALKKIGYGYIYYRGQKSYNGVVILSKFELKREECFDFCSTNEARHICCSTKEGIHIHNFYVPAGGNDPNPKSPKFDYKLKFLDAINSTFSDKKTSKTIILGDFNVAPYPIDVWSHQQMKNVVSHTEIETKKLKYLIETVGFKDVIREHMPGKKLYSWWSYRSRDWRKSNRGRRLDHIFSSHDIMGDFLSASVEKEIRDWFKPSDHVPVIATINV